MKDEEIVALYFARDEQAVARTDEKYGGYCFTLANRILCNESDADVSARLEAKELTRTIAAFLDTQSQKEQNVFLRRYFFVEDTEEIAQRYHMTPEAVLKSLSRTRKKLKAYLIQEGYAV